MLSTDTIQSRQSHRLLQSGVVLLFLGLVGGFFIPMMANPRMGLSSHLEGVMNGMLLMILGLTWTRLRLGPRALVAGFWLAIFGTFTNWGTTLVASLLGAGESMMPLAAEGYRGGEIQEALIAVSLGSLALAVLTTVAIVFRGLRGTALDGSRESEG